MGRNLVYRAVTCRSCVALGLATFGTNAPRPERSDKLAVARVPASSIAESLGSRTSAQDKMVPMTGSNWLWRKHCRMFVLLTRITVSAFHRPLWPPSINHVRWRWQPLSLSWALQVSLLTFEKSYLEYTSTLLKSKIICLVSQKM